MCIHKAFEYIIYYYNYNINEDLTILEYLQLVGCTK